MGKIKNLFLNWYKLKVFVNRIDYKFEDARDLLLEAIKREMQSSDHMLDTNKTYEEIVKATANSEALSEIIDLVLQSPGDECLTTF